MPMSLSAKLDRTLRAAGLAFDGVSIGRKNDKSTWSVQYGAEPTAAQEQIAASVIASFDPNHPSLVAAEAEQDAAAALDSNKPLLALARTTYRYLGPNKPATVEAFIKEIRQAYKAL